MRDLITALKPVKIFPCTHILMQHKNGMKDPKSNKAKVTINTKINTKASLSLVGN